MSYMYINIKGFTVTSIGYILFVELVLPIYQTIRFAPELALGIIMLQVGGSVILVMPLSLESTKLIKLCRQWNWVTSPLALKPYFNFRGIHLKYRGIDLIRASLET